MTEFMDEAQDITFVHIDPRPGSGEALVEALRPDVSAEELIHVATLHQGLEAFLSAPFGIFLISATLPQQEQIDFLADIQRAKEAHRCSFVQLHDEPLGPHFDIAPLRKMGYQTAVSLAYEVRDRRQMRKLIRQQRDKVRVEERKNDVEDATRLILEEIDRVAQFRKRGVQRALGRVGADFMAEHADHKEIFQKYLETLSKKSEAAPAPPEVALRVPPQLLKKKRKLPRLSEDGYSGVSGRVYKKLLKLHGVDPNANPECEAEDAAEDVETQAGCEAQAEPSPAPEEAAAAEETPASEPEEETTEE